MKKKNIILTHEQALEAQQNTPLPTPQTTNVIDIKQADQVHTLCVLLILDAVVSFLSVPRILELFNVKTSLNLSWTPHFTSVINWTLRAGLGQLKQVQFITQPWLAVIDHSIDVGTKKALVVLRVKPMF